MNLIRKYLLLKSILIIFLFTIVVITAITAYFTKVQHDKLTGLLEIKAKALSRVGAVMIGESFDFAIRAKILTLQDVFDREYKMMDDRRFNIPRYNTRYDFYTDTAFLRIQDEFLRDPEVIYAISMDQGGYVPTHNTRYQARPHAPDSPERKHNATINRTKRIFKDDVALKCIANTVSGFSQEYQMSNSDVRVLDVSTPIYVAGERWGSFRVGVSRNKINEMLSDVKTIFIVGGIILLALFVLLTFFILHFMILSKVRKINAKISRIAYGDLTTRTNVRGIDEIGQTLTNLNNMAANLDRVISEAFKSTRIVVKASEEITDGNNDLSARTENQATALEQTAAAMEEMTATVKHNSENADKANQLALKARENAIHGGDVLNRSVSAMEMINDSSKRIAEIITVIDEIAFQTNLLALNAAVEAARAGEKGRGFAVVAVEVRNLAGRSSQAAKEIYALIQDSNFKVDEGSQLVNESGEVFKVLVEDIKQLADFISEVASASKEQYVGIEEVNRAITQMDEMTQKNAALVEEISSSSQEMKRRILELKNSVDYFNVSDSSLKAEIHGLTGDYAMDNLSGSTDDEYEDDEDYDDDENDYSSSVYTAKFQSIVSEEDYEDDDDDDEEYEDDDDSDDDEDDDDDDEFYDDDDEEDIKPVNHQKDDYKPSSYTVFGSDSIGKNQPEKKFTAHQKTVTKEHKFTNENDELDKLDSDEGEYERF